jgi:prophage DNA circulation protein
MTWTERLREPAYTSPSGRRFLFIYEDVSRSFDKRTSGYDSPDAPGTFVQDLGVSGRRYPLRMIFTGADCDLEADAFFDALAETGQGLLEHPRYGRVDVVPFGTVTQRDDLKTAANQSIIEVTFWATTGTVYPTSQADPRSDVVAAVGAFNDAGAAEFADGVSLDTAVERATFSQRFKATLDGAQSRLQSIADATDSVREQFDAVSDSIDQGLNVLIEQPLTLAFQTYRLIQLPGQTAALISDKLDAYRNLATSLISGDGAAVGSRNDLQRRDLYASGAVTGSINSTLNTEFATKADALLAAEEILDQFDQVNAWREASFAALGEVDTGGAYQALQSAVALTAGFMVELSFSLAQERRIVLDCARTIIDVCAELYGEVDERLDFLINSNGLTGSEILELPRGREIVFFL